MSIKILSADEIKQKKNSYDIPPVLFANPKNLYQRRAKRLRELAKDQIGRASCRERVLRLV